VLPPEVVARIAIEQASTFGWERYVGGRGGALSAWRRFGASAPLKETPEKVLGSSRTGVILVAKELLSRC